MKRYVVHGYTTVNVTIEVDANNPDEALEVASDNFGGLIPYAGNGSLDQLVGVEGDEESISADDEVSWSFVEEI